MTDLGTLGGSYSTAYGLNNAGAVVGKADTETFGQTHAFLWQSGQMTDLGTLGGLNSLAYRISDTGTVAGSSETGAGDTRHAFLWQGGQMRDLGTLPGTSDSVAYDVNAAGDAVGSSAPTLDSPAKRAFLWHDGRLLDLNSLLPACLRLDLDRGPRRQRQGPDRRRRHLRRPRPRLPADAAVSVEERDPAVETAATRARNLPPQVRSGPSLSPPRQTSCFCGCDFSRPPP